MFTCATEHWAVNRKLFCEGLVSELTEFTVTRVIDAGGRVVTTYRRFVKARVSAIYLVSNPSAVR